VVGEEDPAGYGDEGVCGPEEQPKCRPVWYEGGDTPNDGETQVFDERTAASYPQHGGVCDQVVAASPWQHRLNCRIN